MTFIVFVCADPRQLSSAEWGEMPKAEGVWNDLRLLPITSAQAHKEFPLSLCDLPSQQRESKRGTQPTFRPAQE